LSRFIIVVTVNMRAPCISM